MAGRKGSTPKEMLKNAICKYRDVFQESIPPISDNVYVCLQQELREQLNCNMSDKAIQICIKRHKDYFFNSDYGKFNLCEENEETDSYYIVTFQMSLAEYSNIVPRSSIYRLLPNKWTNELQDQIFYKTDLVCTFAFKYSYIPTDSNVNNIKCSGRCTQCNAILSLSISPPSENCVKVTCEITNYNKMFPHDSLRKNKLTSDRVTQFKEKLNHEKALKVQHTMADEVMTMDNPKQPNTFPSLPSLRKMRHQVRSALQFDKNTILSLYAMAHCIPYDTFIRKISLVPFFIYFWTNEQNEYYNECLKNTPKILSIDATGSLFQPIEPPASNDFLKHRTSKHIFLYAIVAYTSLNSSVPICYMASESHTMETIATWLTTWLSGKDLPNEIICDDSSALLGAITKVFLKTEFSDYINQCFDVLQGKSIQIPRCYVRMDKSHFIKKLYKQSCFDKTTEKSKFFYISCLKHLQQLSSYEEVKAMLKDLVTLSLHEFKYADLNFCQSKCDIALKNLRLKILNQEKDETHTEIEIDMEVERVIDEYDQENIPLHFYEDLIQTEKLYLQLVEPSYEKNEYFLPEFTNTLKRLLKKLPLWGCVMKNYFKVAKDYASSSNVENHFKDLKTIYFDTKNRRVRLDEFLVQHHGFINGAVKLSSSHVSQKIDSVRRVQQSRQIIRRPNKRANLPLKGDDNDFEVQSVFRENPIKIENWRGLAISTPRRLKTKPLYILQNGNIANSKVTENMIVITNTCAFDSIAQSFAIAYKDRTSFKDCVDERIKKGECDDFITLIKELSNAKQDSKKIYGLREKLLLQLFKTSNKVVDCSCNTTKILDEICTSSVFISATRQRICSNSMCPSHLEANMFFNCKYLPLNLDLITKKGIKNLREACESCLLKDITPNCYFCRAGNVSFTYDVKNIIIFELHDIRIMLDDLPLNIEINGKDYQILSVIEYEPASVPGGIGHYRAHCYRKNNKSFECYDDLYTQIQRSSKHIMPHVIVYLLE